jgi:hypothetical protein
MPASTRREASRLRHVLSCAAVSVAAAAACAGATATTTDSGTTSAGPTQLASQPQPTSTTEPTASARSVVARLRLRPLLGPRFVLPLALHHVTRDRDTDRYDLLQEGNAILIEAPASNRSTPKGSATRAVIWSPQSASVRDATTCATWARSEPWGQEGLALRVQVDANRFRALVIAKNTVFGASWQFNVYSWDSARDPYFQVHGSVNLTPVFTEGPGRPVPLPWRVCARTEGSLVRIKGWDTHEPQPGWRAPDHTGTVAVPNDLVYEGHAGWYVGHIEPGEFLALADLRAYARKLGS